MNTIKLFDESTFTVSDKEKDMIEKSIARSNEGFIRVRGNMIKKNAISSITPGAPPEATDLKDYILLPSGKRCTGSHSINRHLMKEAAKRKNPRLLADKDWREKTKAKLYKESKEWCDVEKGSCYCEN